MAQARTKLARFSLLSALAIAAGGVMPLQAAEQFPSVSIVPSDEARALMFNGTIFHHAEAPIRDKQVHAFAGSPTVMISWQEGNASYFAISREGDRIDQVRQAGTQVRLRYATFDPLVELPAVPHVLRAGPENELFLVQFVGTPLEEMRQEIRAMGGVVERFLTDNTHIVRMGPEAREWVETLPYVRWVGPFHPAYRVDEEILAQVALGGMDGGENIGLRYSISTFRRGMEQQQVIADLVREMGGHIDIVTPDQFRMEVTVTFEQILELAQRNEVHFIDPWLGPGGTDMAFIRQLGGVEPLLNNLGFRGQGVRGWIFDSGVIMNHVEWGGQEPLVIGANANASHGTACYGINFAVGINPEAIGMMPEREQGMATVHSHSTQFNGPATRLSLNLLALDPNGPFRAVFQTASVGSPRNRVYSTITEEVDDYLWQAQLLSCQSQSNASGENRDSRPQAWAKNIVAVGGMQFNQTLDRSQHAWNSGASIGPAADLRIKPELSHSFNNIRTTNSTNATAYGGFFGGTSGATPITCGHFGVLHQMWHEGVWEDFGGASSVFESRPASTTARAIMINTAHRYPIGQGSLNRHRYGWGVAHLGNAYELREKTFIVNETDLLTNAQVESYPIHVEPGEAELKFTMVYIDPAGSPSAQQARINDLDLKVTSPTGVVYWGNHNLVPTDIAQPGSLDGENWSIPGGSPNDYDTVENVFIQNPEAGVWTVEIIGSQIVQDAVPSVPGVQASFALVVTGGTGGPPPAVRMTFPGGLPNLVAPNQGHEVTVTIEDGSQTLVPGSAKVHFRADSSGTWAELPLTHVSGDEYSAVLPGFDCGDEPEIYFSAQGDLGETVFLPRNAPDIVYSTKSGIIVAESLLEQATFETAWPTGWTATGLWNPGNVCLPGGTPCAPGPYAYYGRTTTCNYHLPTGANKGELIAPRVQLPTVPPDGNIELSFCYSLETEEHASFDRAEIFVNGETRPEWRVDDAEWATMVVDLTEFAGQEVDIEWRFDTVTGTNNNHRGWHIANVSVTANVLGCPSCYADCDGNETLNVDDFMCFINSFSTQDPYADCDGNGLFNIDDFMCFINEFAQGCE